MAAGLFGDLINPSDFIKRTTLLFILPGSLIASFFFSSFPAHIICGQFAALPLLFESDPLR